MSMSKTSEGNFTERTVRIVRAAAASAMILSSGILFCLESPLVSQILAWAGIMVFLLVPHHPDFVEPTPTMRCWAAMGLMWFHLAARCVGDLLLSPILVEGLAMNNYMARLVVEGGVLGISLTLLVILTHAPLMNMREGEPLG